MDKLELGPNGAFMYAIEYLEKNIQWLKDQIEPYTKEEHYFLFDFPGQVELYTHHLSVRNIVDKIQKWNFRLTAVHLVDSFVCSQASNYVSALFLSLSTMLQLELPHVNVLSKIDLIEKYGKLDFNLEFYTDVMDLSYLQQHLDQDPFSKKFAKLNKALCGLIEDFSLVAFHTLNIEDQESVMSLVRAIDKSNGFVFGGITQGNESIFELAQRENNWDYERYPFIELIYFLIS